MLRKLACCLLAFAFLVPAALAEDWDKPSHRNPQDAYDFFIEESDGSEQLVFMTLDIINDEETIVHEAGSLHVDMHFVDENGNPVYTIHNQLLITDYGKMQIISVDIDGVTKTIYSVGSFLYNYNEENGVIVKNVSDVDADVFNETWGCYIFPFGPIELMHGMRQDALGYSYFLIKGDEFTTYEFVAAQGMNTVENRVYANLGNNELQLSMIITFSTTPAPVLPDSLLAQLKEDFSVQEASSSKKT